MHLAKRPPVLVCFGECRMDLYPKKGRLFNRIKFMNQWRGRKFLTNSSMIFRVGNLQKSAGMQRKEGKYGILQLKRFGKQGKTFCCHQSLLSWADQCSDLCGFKWLTWSSSAPSIHKREPAGTLWDSAAWSEHFSAPRALYYNTAQKVNLVGSPFTRALCTSVEKAMYEPTL